MRDDERLAIEWCQRHGVDPMEYVPYVWVDANFVRHECDVPRYLAITGGIILREPYAAKGVAIQ